MRELDRCFPSGRSFISKDGRVRRTRQAGGMAGANPASVQRILRHSDPRITTEVYGHLVPDYLRAEIDRLSFGIAPPPKPSSDSPTLGAVPTGLATSVLQPRPIEAPDKKIGPTDSNDSEDFDSWAWRDSNLLPPASEAGALSK
jgi:hypothetical protein